MPRLFFKIFASILGFGLVLYLIKRNIKVWELEVIEAKPAPIEEKTPPTVPVKKKKPVAKPAGDDLKKIKGIGPAIEKKLKGLGLTTFQQIADLTAQDIAQIEEKLNGFAGRVERDDWIVQAKQLSSSPND